MSQAEDDPTGLVSLRIDDPELATALEDAADEVGSKSKTVRSALREKLLEESEEDVEPFDGDVPRKAREGHRKLAEFVGLDGHIEVDAAESIMANHLNIKTLSVRQVVTRPLVNAGWLTLQQGVHEVALVGVPLLGLAGAVVLYRPRESGAGTSSSGASGAAVSLIARGGGAFTSLVRVLSGQPRVLIALGAIGAIATGIIQLPPGTGILLVVAGLPLLTYFAMQRFSGEFRPVVFGTVSVVAIVLGLQVLGADPVGKLLDSLGPGVLILALGLIGLAWQALQAARAPDEVNKITIGDGDS